MKGKLSMKRKSLFPLLLLSVFILGMPKSLALTQEEREANQASRQEARTSKVAEVCSNISERISTRKGHIEKSITSVNNMVSKVETVVNKRIASLNEKGVDTSELTNNLATFKTNANSLISSKQTSLNTLAGIDVSTCETNRTAFSETIKSFNSTLKQQNADQKALKTYVRENLIAKIKALGNSNQ